MLGRQSRKAGGSRFTTCARAIEALETRQFLSAGLFAAHAPRIDLGPPLSFPAAPRADVAAARADGLRQDFAPSPRGEFHADRVDDFAFRGDGRQFERGDHEDFGWAGGGAKLYASGGMGFHPGGAWVVSDESQPPAPA